MKSDLPTVPSFTLVITITYRVFIIYSRTVSKSPTAISIDKSITRVVSSSTSSSFSSSLVLGRLGFLFILMSIPLEPYSFNLISSIDTSLLSSLSSELFSSA